MKLTTKQKALIAGILEALAKQFTKLSVWLIGKSHQLVPPPQPVKKKRGRPRKNPPAN